MSIQDGCALWGSRIVVPKLGRTSSDFADFMTQNRIRHIRVAHYHPSSNGLVEQAVQSFKLEMKKQLMSTIQIKLSHFLFTTD